MKSYGWTMSHADLSDAWSDEGQTALILAARNGHLEVVEALLKAGADPDHATADGRTALIMAAEGGHATVVESLLRAGADPNLATVSMGNETYGTAEELDAFLDGLLARGDQLKQEIADIGERIRRSVLA